MASGLPQLLTVGEGGTGGRDAATALSNLGIAGISTDVADSQMGFAVTAGTVKFDGSAATDNLQINIPALQDQYSMGVLISKNTTGDPTSNAEGLWCLNTADNSLRIYGGGAWRAVATW